MSSPTVIAAVRVDGSLVESSPCNLDLSCILLPQAGRESIRELYCSCARNSTQLIIHGLLLDFL